MDGMLKEDIHGRNRATSLPAPWLQQVDEAVKKQTRLLATGRQKDRWDHKAGLRWRMHDNGMILEEMTSCCCQGLSNPFV